jgi:hypothetical protein
MRGQCFGETIHLVSLQEITARRYRRQSEKVAAITVREISDSMLHWPLSSAESEELVR